MPSDAAICNLALSHFGQSAAVISINPPGDSVEEQQSAIFYPIARDQMLEDYDWTFARKRATLTQLVNDRDDFNYAYRVPIDCLMPRRLMGLDYNQDDEGLVYQIEGSTLYTDEDQVTLVYTQKLTTTGVFTAQFVVALSWLLASYLSGPITKDASGGTQARLYQRAEIEARKAQAADGNSDTKTLTYTPTAARAR